MIISIDEKTEKIQFLFMIKVSEQTRNGMKLSYSEKGHLKNVK